MITNCSERPTDVRASLNPSAAAAATRMRCEEALPPPLHAEQHAAQPVLVGVVKVGGRLPKIELLRLLVMRLLLAALLLPPLVLLHKAVCPCVLQGGECSVFSPQPREAGLIMRVAKDRG